MLPKQFRIFPLMLALLAGLGIGNAHEFKGRHTKEKTIRKEFRVNADALLKIENSYGNTVLSPDHIREHWGQGGFEVVDVLEGIIDHRQDLVVLEKAEPEVGRS